MRLLPLLLAACATTPPVTSDERDDSESVDTDLPRFGCAPTAWKAPPACGTATPRTALLPGPGLPSHEGALEALALGHDRLFAAFTTATMGVNTEVVVPAEATALRSAMAEVATGDAGALSTLLNDPATLGATWQKSAGAYAGVGIAADAFRYGVLRDEGAPCAEVEAARAQLVRALEGLHRASVITGVPGVIARGYAQTGAWSYGSLVEPVPMFDGAGAPLPEEKTNGTWRVDGSGTLEGWVWEDSCSRDMLIGWTMGFGAAWEVIAQDPTIPDLLKADLQADARALATTLTTVQESGYDLEIRDADGRMTYHGILHEDSIDRAYIPGAGNGLNAMMSLGALAALALVAEDADLYAWIDEELIGRRRLHEVARDRVGLIDFGVGSNYSNYNMAFIGGLQAQRWLCSAEARTAVAEGLDGGLYARPDRPRQPEEQGQSLYDLTAALARMEASAWAPSAREVDPDLLDRTLATLTAWPAAPSWDVERINCDADEVEAGTCEAVDGSTITLYPGSGRGDTLVAAHPLPFAVRPPSNYTWRSNPYQVNGGGSGTVALSAVDFRFVVWLGRWAQATPRD